MLRALGDDVGIEAADRHGAERFRFATTELAALRQLGGEAGEPLVGVPCADHLAFAGLVVGKQGAKILQSELRRFGIRGIRRVKAQRTLDDSETCQACDRQAARPVQ